MPTIKDVAKEAQVSIATVSFVLNDRDVPITKETKAKVWAAADKLGYIPNRVARSLVTKRTQQIALVVPDITNPFFPEIAKQVELAAREFDYHVILLNGTGNELVLQTLKESFIDGALVVSRDNEINYNLKKPVVFLDEEQDERKQSYVVTCDNFAGGQLAGQHLIKLGHRRIACVSGPENTPNSKLRWNGFKKALEGHDVSVLMLPGDYSFESGYNVGQDILRTDVTAVFCFNDLSALGLMKYLTEQNVSIPDDISLIGFDNINLTNYISPGLTTIHQDMTAIAKAAVACLMSLIQKDKVTTHNVRIKPKLILRETTCQFK